MTLDKINENNIIEWIDSLTTKSLKSMQIIISPPKEQIEKDISRIRKTIIESAWNDMDLVEFISNAEIVYSWLYNWEFLYWVLRERDWTISAFFNSNWINRIPSWYTRDPYPNRTDIVADWFRKLYNKELNQLWYKEEKWEDGMIRTYKIDKEWNKTWNEIDIRSKEYFDLHCELQEWLNIKYVKRIRDVKKQWEPLSKNVLNDALYFRVLTFDDIEFFKSNWNITEEQYNQAKEQIAKYYYRLVFLWIIKKSEAKDITQEYFDKQYISKDTYDRTMKYLNDKE